MDLGLKNKVAFVSGSTKGIGFATALGLAKEGAKVVINGRTEASVSTAISGILAQSPNAHIEGIVADLGTAQGCKVIIESLPEVDVLINNVGIFEPKAFEDIPDEDWDRLFEVNVMSGVRLSRHYLPLMKAKNWGRVVFLSSESAIQIPEEMVHYGTTKAAQIALSRGMAESTKGTNVTVNAVLPGPTRSEGVEDFIGELAEKEGKTFDQMEQEFFQGVRPSSLIQRFAACSEVANLIVYLSGTGASATNGAALRVDGGVVRAAF